jgi:hypothetical protein
MSPFHTGFVRELRTTTALQCSAAWLVSENVRFIREQQQEARYVVALSPSVDKMITDEIALSGVRSKLNSHAATAAETSH